jgi:hypothetical protein
VSTIPRVVALSGLTVTLGCGDTPVSRSHAPATDAALSTAQGDRLSALRILFGHQSVGGNLMDGLADLAREGEPLPLAVTRTLRVDSAGRGVIAHEWVGENGAPASKLAAVGAALSGTARGANVAIVKFCYSDFQAGTDPDALFAAYRDQIAAWQLRFPGVTFVHVTAPTVRPEGAAVRWVRTLRGRFTMRARAATVARYNERLREAYSGREPVIDLAAYEAAGPEGGVEAPFLHPAFTDDGEHLNDLGRRTVARRFLHYLADSVAPRVTR